MFRRSLCAHCVFGSSYFKLSSVGSGCGGGVGGSSCTHSLIDLSTTSTFRGNIWGWFDRLLRDQWEIDGIFEGSLSVRWDYFWTESKLWGDRADHLDVWRSLGAHWKIVEWSNNLSIMTAPVLRGLRNWIPLITNNRLIQTSSYSSSSWFL